MHHKTNGITTMSIAPYSIATNECRCLRKTHRTTRGGSRSTITPPRAVGVGAQALIRAVLIAGTILIGTGAAVAQQQPRADDTKERSKELGEKLIRTVGSGGEEDLMQAIMRRMDESARRIGLDFDAGEDTQLVQETITKQLDEAIKIAASQRRRISRSEQPQRSDKRRSADHRKNTTGKGTATVSGDDTTTTSDAGSSPTEQSQSGQDLKESRRAWGNLPRREREEIIQGAGEHSLDRFREWIDRYYRALQESRDAGGR